VQQTSAHIVTGTASATNSGTVVTLTGSAAFSSSTSYKCALSSQASQNAQDVLTYQSGTQFTITAGQSTHNVSFICVGN
jgi:hypothetical protein